jgi:hypothetical protein
VFGDVFDPRMDVQIGRRAHGRMSEQNLDFVDGKPAPAPPVANVCRTVCGAERPLASVIRSRSTTFSHSRSVA